MGMKLHGLANNIGNLVETAVIHVVQGLEDTPLDRFQPIVDIRDSTLLDHVGGVLEKISVERDGAVYLPVWVHIYRCRSYRPYTRCSMIYCLRSGVFLPI